MLATFETSSAGSGRLSLAGALADGWECAVPAALATTPRKPSQSHHTRECLLRQRTGTISLSYTRKDAGSGYSLQIARRGDTWGRLHRVSHCQTITG